MTVLAGFNRCCACALLTLLSATDSALVPAMHYLPKLQLLTLRRGVSSTAAVLALTHNAPKTDAQILNNVHQPIAGRKRFYKNVGVAEVTYSERVAHHSHKEVDTLYKVTLDGRTLKTPARNNLFLPNKLIATAIAAEWDAQVDERKGIQPATMPLMTLASTAIDQVRLSRDTSVNTCMSYLSTDTALFFTTEEDRLLLKKQKQQLQPIIRYLKKTFELDLSTKNDMYGRIQHPEETRRKIEWMVNQLVRIVRHEKHVIYTFIILSMNVLG